MPSQANSIRAGSAFVELFADDSALQKGLASAEKSVKQFGLSVGKIGAAIGGLGAAITGPLIAATNVFANAGSALNDMSERTGISVEALSALSFAAEQTGTSMETVETAIRKMQKALTAGSAENQTAMAAFNALGLSVQKLTAMKPEEAFAVIGKRIAAINNPTIRAAASMMIFNKSASELLPMMKDFNPLVQQAKDFNLIWTPEEAKAADALGDSISLLNQVIKKNIALVGGALAPSFTRWNVMMANVSKQIGQFIKANQSLIVTISTVGFALVAAGTAIVTLGTVIFGLGQIIGVASGTISLLYGALTFLLSPLGLALVAVVGLTAAFLHFTETGQEMADDAKANFGSMLDTAKETFTGISDAMQAGDIALAAQVLFAGLKVEFLQGTTSLAKIWNDWGVGLVEDFKKTSFDIASGLLALQSVADIAFERIEASRKKHGLAGTISETAKVIMPPTAFDVIARAGGAPDTQDMLRGMLTGQMPEIKGPQTKPTEAEQKALDVQRALRSAQATEEENRRKAAADAVDAAENELALAQIELHKVGMRAEKAKERAAAKALVDAAFGRDEDAKLADEEETPEDLAAGVKAAAAKTDVTGTFSALAASGMGVGSSIDKQSLDEQKKTNEHLEKIRKDLQKRETFKN